MTLHIACFEAGAAKGIGYACASALLEEGCSVALADIDEPGVQR